MKPPAAPARTVALTELAAAAALAAGPTAPKRGPVAAKEAEKEA